MKTFTSYAVIFLLALLSGSNVWAQNASGEIDLTFNPGDTGYGNLLGPGSRVYSVIQQPDGKILIGGDFTTYNNVTKRRIVRINTDGSVDNTFNVGEGFTNTNTVTVRSLVLQPDGKIIAVGRFNAYNGVDRNSIVRLNSDGSLDESFNPGTGIAATSSQYIQSAVLQPDGKIIIGGLFTTYNGVSKSRIARLNADGSLDTTFEGTGTSTTAAHYVYSVALQNDGKILIGGNFTSYNGTNVNRVARLNSDGTLDTTFNTGTGSANAIRNITVQNDGKILIGGEFSAFNGTAAGRLIRLNEDGSIDPGFNPGGIGGNSGGIFSIKIQPDNKILIGGTFTQFNGISQNGIARLNTDGTIDTTLTIGNGTSGELSSIEIDANGNILIAGSFTHYNLVPRRYLTRISSTGELDYTFNPETGVNGSVYTNIQQPDGKILIGGYFSYVNGAPVRNLARLNLDGSVDTTFDTGEGPRGTGIVERIALQDDGKILIGGYFSTYDGIARERIARLNPDGSLDETFNPGTGAAGNSPRINSIAIQPDGKILIGGLFESFNGTAIKSIVRLNSDGSIDTTFNSGGTGLSNSHYVYSILVQDDGKIVIIGDFESYNGIPAVTVTRLNADGTLDEEFNTNIGTGATMFGWYTQLYAGALREDGKILIAGLFDNFNGTTVKSIALLNTDGTLDTSNFNSGNGTSWNEIRTVRIQSDGKILIGGNFNIYNDYAVNRLARLNNNGSFDETFDVGIGSDGVVYDITQQYDGRLIISGDFTSYNGIGRNRVARIFSSECTVVEEETEESICEGETFIFGEQELTEAGTYTRVETGDDGCRRIITIILTVNETPELSLGVAPDAICSGSTVTLTATSEGNTVNWYGSEGATEILFTGSEFTTPELTETTTYWVEALNENECTSERVQVTVEVLPAPELIIEITEIQACEGNSVELFAESAGNVIFWYAAEEDTDYIYHGNLFITPELTESTTYWVEAYNIVNECRSERVQVTVNVNPVPDAPIAVTVQEFTQGETLADLEVDADGELTWYADESLTIELPETTLLVDDTTYYVTQTLNGCQSEAVAITVDDDMLGVTDLNKGSFSYYPNPVKDKLYFAGKEDVQYVQVFDLTGKLILEQNSNSIKELNVSNLNKGTYVLKVKTNKQVKTFKIIKS